MAPIPSPPLLGRKPLVVGELACETIGHHAAARPSWLRRARDDDSRSDRAAYEWRKRSCRRGALTPVSLLSRETDREGSHCRAHGRPGGQLQARLTLSAIQVQSVNR